MKENGMCAFLHIEYSIWYEGQQSMMGPHQNDKEKSGMCAFYACWIFYNMLLLEVFAVVKVWLFFLDFGELLSGEKMISSGKVRVWQMVAEHKS